jgi:inner membrane transporter RhtA
MFAFVAANSASAAPVLATATTGAQASANAALFALCIVLAHRAAHHFPSGIDGLAAAMLIAGLCITPLSAAQAGAAFTDPTALAAGIGVGISSSVIPYVCDQLAMARTARSTYALLAALLLATATVIGIAALHQIPTLTDLGGVALVVVGVAAHRESTGPETTPAEAGGSSSRLLAEKT